MQTKIEHALILSEILRYSCKAYRTFDTFSHFLHLYSLFLLNDVIYHAQYKVIPNGPGSKNTHFPLDWMILYALALHVLVRNMCGM